MGIKEVLISLNELKETGIIVDYAIGGGYGVNLYIVPLNTYDLDVFVILAKEDDYHRLYEHYRAQGAKIENVYIYIGGMPVQFLANISPLTNCAVKEAITVEFEGVTSRFISIEYLVVLLLTAYREKDKMRIEQLLVKANKNKIKNLIDKFDSNDNTLRKRYQEILART
jgi:predicted nucleotidyltransferase